MEHLYFAEPIRLAELCSIAIAIPAQQTPHGENKHQPTVIKCRELIFTEPSILASPVLRPEGKVVVILQQSYYRSGKLQARLNRMGLEAEKPRRVSPMEFQDCLQYTLLAKMAPAWNKAGEYLLQGRDFILSKERMQAVVIQLHITETEFYVSLRGHVVRMSPMKLSDLGVCLPVVREFYASRPHGTIQEYSLVNKWCHILPSLKKGQIVSVSHTIPADSPFRSYKDIKRHWKNTYGYRLPEDDEGQLYYQVYFKPIGETLFTYPEYCLRPNGLTVLGRVDPRPIVEAFMTDLESRLPAVCGQRVKFRLNRPQYPQIGLTEIKHQEEHTNLSETAPVPLHTYRQFPVRNSAPATQTQSASSTSKVITAYSACSSDHTKSTIAVQPTAQMDPATADNNRRTMDSKDPQLSVNATKKIVPIFKSQIRKPCVTSVPKAPVQRRAVPTFTSRVPNTQHGVKGFASEFDQILQNNKAFLIKRDNVSTEKRVLSSNKRPLPVRPPYASGSGPVPPRAASSFISGTPRKPGLDANNLAPGQLSSVPGTPMLPQGTRTAHCSTGSVRRTPGVPGTPAKRKLQDCDGTKPKTPRAAPKIQTDVNVEHLAKNNQLNRVNAVTMIAWLKSKGVSCKAKDKKGDLIHKVQEFLHIRAPEV